MQSRREASPGLLIMTTMESGHPLDHLISVADRALRAMFAPAHASRPVPDAPLAPVNAAPAANANGTPTGPIPPTTAASDTTAIPTSISTAGPALTMPAPTSPQLSEAD